MCVCHIRYALIKGVAWVHVQAGRHCVHKLPAHCTHPHVVSLRRKYAPLFSQTGSHDVSAFLKQNNHKLPFFLYELIAFYEQASSRNS